MEKENFIENLYIVLSFLIKLHFVSLWYTDNILQKIIITLMENILFKEMFYLTMHSIHFIYSYMALDILLITRLCFDPNIFLFITYLVLFINQFLH